MRRKRLLDPVAIGGSKVTIGHDCGKVHESFADCVGAIGPIPAQYAPQPLRFMHDPENIRARNLLQIIEL